MVFQCPCRIFYINKSKKVENDITWSGHVLEKIADILTTHVFQIDLYQSGVSAKGMWYIKCFYFLIFSYCFIL